MNILLYFAKLTLISALLFSYYWYALRNKKFHAYNRFYLVITVMLALILPCINIPLLQDNNPGGAAKILHIISVSDWEQAVVITPRHNWLYHFLTWQNILSVLYILVSGLLIFFLAKSIYYVLRVSKKYDWEKIDDIKLFHTSEPESPFSFFKNIFWNNTLDMTSETGNQVFRHELYHVRKNHSFDVLFLELVTCIFWFNPFFYLIKKETKIIHEFLADEYAVSGSDKYGYAELLVMQTVSAARPNIINTFFHSQVKRRIIMMTQIKNKRYHYLSRAMAVPVLFILFCAFSVKTTTAIRSAFAEKIAAKNDSVFYSVENYLIKHLRYPEEILEKNINATVNMEVTLDGTGGFKTITAVEEMPVGVKFYEITVSSKTKFANAGRQEAVTKARFNENVFIPFRETVAKTLSAFHSDKATAADLTLYFRVSFNIEQGEHKMNPEKSQAAKFIGGAVTADTTIRGDTVSAVAFDKINVADIKSLQVIKTDEKNSMIIVQLKDGKELFVKSADLEKYKQDNNQVTSSTFGKIFTKVETEAEFLGGHDAWSRYLIANFHYPDEAVNKEISGEVDVRFIVDSAGNVSNVLAESGPVNGGLREEAIRVIENSGKWIPGVQNGKVVTSYKTQPIVFKLQDQ